MTRPILSLFLALAIILVTGCGRKGELDTGVNISRAEILLLHNREREKAGASPLQYDASLEQNAQKWAENMASRDSLYHSTLKLDGTGFFTMGENIAMGYDDIDSVVDGWMHSTGHRRNILNKQFTHAGFGYARRSDGSPYWCAQFAGKR